MLELPNFGHMTTYITEFGSGDSILLLMPLVDEPVF